jgi:hypothetical protein
MRLTLRTLLAYMDDLLEPQDAIQMGKRIEENKVATELVHRIRTRMRLLRLGAPKVDGKGLGADANSVAEYLDNSLAAERVPDFEKLCLESDVHLAEAASCHQILAAVLDKPAAVDPALRLRVYNLIARADDFADPLGSGTGSMGSGAMGIGDPDMDFGDLAAAQATTAFPRSVGRESVAAGLPPVSGVSVASAPSKTAIPRGALLAATVAIVLLLVLGGLRLAGPFDGRHPLAGMLGMAPPAGESEQLVALGNTDTNTSDDAIANASSDASTNTGTNTSPNTGDAPSANMATGEGVAGNVGPASEAEANVDSADNPGSADNTGIANAVSEPSAPGAAGVAGVANVDGAGVPASGVGLAPPGDAVARARAAGAVAAGEEAVGGGVPDGDKAAIGEETRDAGIMEMGRLLSEEQVVARRNPDDNLWYRLPRGASIAVGDHLVSLPVFRPQFILSTGVQFMVAGEASLRIGVAAGGQAPVLAVESGRLLVATSGRPGAEIQLNLGGQVGSLRFVDADAEAAIEVRREFVPGEDPMVVSAPTTISIAVRRGKVSWSDAMRGGRGDTVVGSGMQARFSPGMDLELSDQPFPAWSSPLPTGGLERGAAEQLAGLMKLDRPLTLSLAELTQFRKTEVRSLAARCLGSLGEYRSLWNELSDERQYSYWDEALDALRSAMVRSAQDALEVRRSAEQLMKQEIALLTQLLRGYDPSQLENGGAAELVDALDHADLEVRVLAFENLRRITGATHNYRPEKPAEARKASLMEWRRQLRDGRIVYRPRSVDSE